MKKLAKSVSGVTLLEVMLVLAVAAMIIVMSVRYYQSANSSQQANSVLSQIQSITGYMDGLAAGNNSYVGLTTANVAPLMPTGGTTIPSPWGGTISVGNGTSNSYIVTISNVPASVCPLILSRLQGNTHFTPGACTANGPTVSFTYTYTSSM